MTPGTTVHSDNQGIVVNVPLRMKKRGGRREIIMPQAFASDTPMRQSHQEALVIALARAHRWQRLLDDGKFASVSELAREIGLDVSFAARLLHVQLDMQWGDGGSQQQLHVASLRLVLPPKLEPGQ